MRKYLGFLLTVLMLTTLTAVVMAERGDRRQSGASDIPQSEAVTKLVAEEQPPWGSSPQEVIRHYSRAYRKVYAPVLAKTPDAIREDRIRREMESRIERIKKSYVKFDGRATGWDSSFLRDQYTHNNGEALVAVREVRATDEDPRYTDYFFFINNKLWRRYRAFDQDAFGGVPFAAAAQSFQKHLGPAKQVRDEEGGLERLMWQDGATKLEAVDNTRFYGFFSLVFTDMATEVRLAELRTNKSGGPRRDSADALLDLVEKAPEVDEDANVVEHLTGKRYKTSQPQKAVGGGDSETPAKARPAKSGAGDPILDSPPRPRKRTGDPLEDLEI